MFGKKKQPTKETFVKRKLSEESLDAFILKFSEPQPSKFSIPHKTKNGNTIYFSSDKLIHGPIKHGTDEFEYLLAQTFPAHQKAFTNYAMSLYSCIMGQDGKPEFWTKNSQYVATLVSIGESLGFMEKNSYKDGLYASCLAISKPIIHIDQKQPEER